VASPRWPQALLVALALGYVAIVLIAPLAALLAEIWHVGARVAFAALDHHAWRALRMSLVLVVIAVVVNGLVGIAGAIVLTRHRFRGRLVLEALADLPLAVSPVMVGLAFLLLVGRGGWITPVFDALHCKVVFAFPGLMLATLFVTLPYTIREVAYVLEEIGTSEEEAAATLGASPWQIFWRVTLPNIRFGLAYGLLMTAARSLGEFGAVLVLGGSISGETQTATTFIHDSIEERDLPAAYAMALLLALISTSLLFALERAKKRRREG
jgi:sulfate transport system permease protein